MMLRKILWLSVLLFVPVASAQQVLKTSPFYNNPAVNQNAVDRFVSKMVGEYGLHRAAVEADLASVSFRQDVLNKLSSPAEKTKTWPDYRQIFVTPDRAQLGVTFIREHQAALVRAQEQYGVPINVIVAIIGVETKYGANKGNTPVFDALATIAFAYPKREKFFTSELAHYFRYLRYREPQLFTNNRVGSYAGAMGIPQFMPSSYQNHAVDYDGDGVRDLFDSPVDAIGSVANYLSHFGWQPGQPVFVSLSAQEKASLVAIGWTKKTATAAAFIQNGIGIFGLSKVPPSQQVSVVNYDLGNGGTDYKLTLKNFRVIKRYNQSDYYVTAVTDLANLIAQLF